MTRLRPKKRCNQVKLIKIIKALSTMCAKINISTQHETMLVYTMLM